MGRLIVASFEGKNIKIVYATSKGAGFKVNDALTLKEEQFDEFLRKEKTKEFIVVCDFENFHQEIILIPPVKSKYLKTLVAAEIKKRAPDLKDFSFTYTPIGEKIIGNRKMLEVFTYAVDRNEIKNVLDRFIGKGKIVTSIYPNVLSLGIFLQSSEKPSLCILECNSHKNLFLLKNGKIIFIRTARSVQRGITDLDIQNINMTIHYCQQTLRVDPSDVVFFGGPSESSNSTMPILKPVAPFQQPASIQAVKEVFHEYIVPISALFRQKEINFLPYEYKSLYLIRKAFVYSIALFLSLSIVGAAYISLQLEPIFEVKNMLVDIKSNSPDIEKELNLYYQKNQELKKYTTLLNFSKDAASLPSTQKLLIALSKASTTNIKITLITITPKEKNLEIVIQGLMTIDGYSNMKTYFQNFVNTISNLDGMNIKKQTLSLGKKSFVVELDYNV